MAAALWGPQGLAQKAGFADWARALVQIPRNGG